MEFHVVIPVLISFAISLVLGPIVIPFLRRLKMGQTERELGVQSHLKKNGTPTMGGVIFLIATTVTSLFYIIHIRMIQRKRNTIYINSRLNARNIFIGKNRR